MDLESAGLINNGLFEVDGELAVRYNRVLREVFGLESELDRFRVDKRGMSPEVASHLAEKNPERPEIAEDYLCIGEHGANRYMVIVSPDQRGAPLIDPKSSYEDDLCDKVYMDARHTIEEVTEREPLFGEFDNDTDVITSPDDLLNIRIVKVRLESLDKTIESGFELKKLLAELKDGNNALNPEYISKVQELVRKVGDPRGSSISSDLFPISRELNSFYDRAFGGVYCLRTTIRGEGKNTLFISPKSRPLPEVCDIVSCHLSIDRNLFELMHDKKFFKYDESLMEQRIREVEDEVLLENQIDVVEMEADPRAIEKRKRFISERTGELGNVWQELRKLQKQVNHGARFSSLMEGRVPYDVRTKLTEVEKKPQVAYPLLAEFDPSDVYRRYKTHPQALAREFATLPTNRKKYIVTVLLKNRQENIK